MAKVSEGSKKNLKISHCEVDTKGNITKCETPSFEAMLNPSSYNHSYSIGYNKTKTQGQAGQDVKFSGINPEKVKFDILIDGTGVVDVPSSLSSDVKTQVKTLTDIVYKYNGESHQPDPVKVLWGSLVFFGRLESMSVEYTLFKPNGEPLRAKVNLEFSGFMSHEEEVKRANKSSPDMSHLIEVMAGDTLPLLCYRVYKDSTYYPEVAKINNITNFRDIKPGSLLHFPPLR